MGWSIKSIFQIKGEVVFLRNQGYVCLQACIKQLTWVPEEWKDSEGKHRAYSLTRKVL